MKVLTSCVVLFVLICLSEPSDAAYPRRTREGLLLDIMIPKILLEEFEYVPTKEGYRYSYQLTDGTKREEIGIITNPGAANQGLVIMGAVTNRDDSTTMFTDDAMSGFRSRANLKNRKLSPKTLQSLAG